MYETILRGKHIFADEFSDAHQNKLERNLCAIIHCSLETEISVKLPPSDSEQMN